MATALITSKTKKRTIVLGGFGGADSDWTSVTELLVSPEELARSLFAALQGRGCKSPKEVDKINRLADACLNTVDKKVNETRQDERRKLGEWLTGPCPHGHDAPVRVGRRFLCSDCRRQFLAALRVGDSLEGK